MNTAERCPTCGRSYPKKRSQPKYRTHAERLAAVHVAIKATTDARAERDRQEILPLLPLTFRSRDVGEALRKVGRHWSEHLAVLNRLVARGWIVLEGLDPDDRRMVRVWRKADAV